jgi:hypothetical protein
VIVKDLDQLTSLDVSLLSSYEVDNNQVQVQFYVQHYEHKMTNTMELVSLLFVVAIMVANTRIWAAPYEVDVFVSEHMSD